MAKQIGIVKARALPIAKRTSQGIKNKPKGKHARKNWKAYRGQGRAR